MEVRSGYKQTDLGVIPEDWEVKPLGELFEITSSKRVFQSEWKAQGVPFYRARELAVLGESGAVDNDLFITQEMYDTFKQRHGVPAAGDMLVTGVGTLGKTYVVSGDHDFYFKDGNIIWFKIGDSLSSEFLRQLYLTPVVIKQIGDGSAGTTVGTYTISGAKKTRIPFPPLSEQRAIAAALSDVDALLGGLDRLIAKKRDLKQAAMQQLLTGQIRLPGFHGEWEVKRLGDVANIKTGSRNNEDKVEDGQYPFYVRSEVVERINSYSHDCEAILVPGEGRIGSIFHYISGRFDVHQRVYAITQFEPQMSAQYVHAYMAMHFGSWAMQNTVKATVDSLRLPTFQSFKMRVPPTKDEQTAIAAVLSEMDAELTALEARRDKTRALKQAMMQELLTGRIRLIRLEDERALAC